MRTLRIAVAVLLSLLLNFGSEAVAQINHECSLAGTYRINSADSDQLYSAVENAVSGVPFGEQQRFFFDLSIRLTPPDMLAFDCSGRRVSVASSRAPKITFLADGKTRNERKAGGGSIQSRVELAKDTLTFTSSGKTDDRVNVIFQSLENGRRVRVTRSIYTDQLAGPVVIRTLYDKIAEWVQWDIYDNDDLAARQPKRQIPTIGGSYKPATAENRSGSNNAAALRSALGEWVAATNNRDIDGQMMFYMPQLEAFYLTRNSPRSAVRREKNQSFARADSIDIRAKDPEIVFQESGATAVMRFRKEYKITAGKRIRGGVVIQELRWRRTNNGWRIFSERDIRVIR
ncbi:MAG: nuclear transport factor 2 family protein [Pyrinomonadaceae bacterium]